MGQILLDGIVKSYGKEVVVKNLDLLVEPGEFLTILGPSGCGKTAYDSGQKYYFSIERAKDIQR